MFQGFQSRKMVKIDSSSQKNILFSSEHQEYTFNNLFRNTSPKKNKWFSAAKIGKSRSLKRIEKRKFFREKFFFSWNRSPGHTEYTSNTPDDNISPDFTDSKPEPTIDKKSEIYEKNFPERLLPNRRMQFCHPSRKFYHLIAENFPDKLRKQRLGNIFFSETNVLIKMLYSTRRVQFWQLCQTFDKKFWINFVSKSEINWNTLFFLEKKLAYLDNVPLDTSKPVLETLSNFFFCVLKFCPSKSDNKWWEDFFFKEKNFGYNVTLDIQNSV